MTEPTEPTEPTTEPVDPPTEPEGEQQPTGRLPDDHPLVTALARIKDEAKQLRSQVREFEDRDKTEDQRLKERIAELETSASEAARLRVAIRKGLTETQARRLVGATEEELEADAEQLLADFRQDRDDGRRPQERLRPGATPSVEPDNFDPAKIVERIPRNW
jgi:hypothetical protein